MIWIPIAILILLTILFLMICPSLRSHPNRKMFENIYVAHRGLHDISKGIPENSIPAYKQAIKHRYAIEIDIHLTKDGRVAVFHDDTLKRVCGVDKKVESMTYQEIASYTLFDTEYTVPTLEQVLETIDGNTLLVIEYKCSPGNYKALCVAADKILKNYKGKYIVQSFNPLAMGWFKIHRPEIFRGQLSTNFIKEPDNDLMRTLVGSLLINFISRPDFISYGYKYSGILQLKICKALGAMSAGWTFTDARQIEKLKDQYSIYIFEGFLP